MFKKKSDGQQLFNNIHLAFEIIGKHTPFLKHLAFIGKQTAANGL